MGQKGQTMRNFLILPNDETEKFHVHHMTLKSLQNFQDLARQIARIAEFLKYKITVPQDKTYPFPP